MECISRMMFMECIIRDDASIDMVNALQKAEVELVDHTSSLILTICENLRSIKISPLWREGVNE